MAQKVIIDADPGIGDALAIALAVLDPNLDVVGVTATAGCVPGELATRNIQAIIEHLDPPKWPRLAQSRDPVPMVRRDTGGRAFASEALNGESGLGDWEFRVAGLHHLREPAKLITDIVRSEPHEVTLLTLGPLTNVELAAERAPDLYDLLKGLVCLGGSVEIGGDVTPAAEFNIAANPEAARSVLKSPATKTLVPADVSHQVVLTFEQYDRLPRGENSPIGSFLEPLVPFCFRAHHEHLGLEGIRLHEVVAVAAVSHPDWFESQPMAVDVETTGTLTRGMTVFDRRRGVESWQTNIDVLVQVDVPSVLDYFLRTLRSADRRER